MSGSAQTAVISWDAVIGKHYQVQFKNDLTSAWTNLGVQLTATNLSLSATDNTAYGKQRVYRVAVAP
jgi:hypothetical protein